MFLPYCKFAASQSRLVKKTKKLEFFCSKSISDNILPESGLTPRKRPIPLVLVAPNIESVGSVCSVLAAVNYCKLFAAFAFSSFCL